MTPLPVAAFATRAAAPECTILTSELSWRLSDARVLRARNAQTKNSPILNHPARPAPTDAMATAVEAGFPMHLHPTGR